MVHPVHQWGCDLGCLVPSQGGISVIVTAKLSVIIFPSLTGKDCWQCSSGCILSLGLCLYHQHYNLKPAIGQHDGIRNYERMTKITHSAMKVAWTNSNKLKCTFLENGERTTNCTGYALTSSALNCLSYSSNCPRKLKLGEIVARFDLTYLKNNQITDKQKNLHQNPKPADTKATTSTLHYAQLQALNLKETKAKPLQPTQTSKSSRLP